MSAAVELLPGTWSIPLQRHSDLRGSFVKTYAAGAMAALGLSFDFREEFYSVSAKNVIRGMHFQIPPHDHDKIVYCPQGHVLDVLLDLRPGEHYGAVRSIVLTPEQPSVIYIPRGVAHGFKAIEDDTLMIYKTSSEHAPSHDGGILWDSFGFDWDCPSPIISQRDRNHPRFADYPTPF